MHCVRDPGLFCRSEGRAAPTGDRGYVWPSNSVFLATTVSRRALHRFDGMAQGEADSGYR
jgi:hypothetical protein